MHKYDDVLSAAKGLLVEAITIIQTTNLEYAIVGGWSPYLRNNVSVSGLIHPGTKDVDVLFLEGCQKSMLKDVVQAFLKQDYLVSAKHDFQLFRSLKVRDYDLVFNVDLLHPLEGKANAEIFVDHLDLGIPEEKLYKEVRHKNAKSVALPYSKYIFDGFVENFALSFTAPNGKDTDVMVPLIDEAGLILSKSISIAAPKRHRDAFDVYLAMRQSNIEKTKRKLKTACRQTKDLKTALETLFNYVTDHHETFDINVMRFTAGTELTHKPSEYVSIFLKDVLI